MRKMLQLTRIGADGFDFRCRIYTRRPKFKKKLRLVKPVAPLLVVPAIHDEIFYDYEDAEDYDPK